MHMAFPLVKHMNKNSRTDLTHSQKKMMEALERSHQPLRFRLQSVKVWFSSFFDILLSDLPAKQNRVAHSQISHGENHNGIYPIKASAVQGFVSALPKMRAEEWRRRLESQKLNPEWPSLTICLQMEEGQDNLKDALSRLERIDYPKSLIFLHVILKDQSWLQGSTFEVFLQEQSEFYAGIDFFCNDHAADSGLNNSLQAASTDLVFLLKSSVAMAVDAVKSAVLTAVTDSRHMAGWAAYDQSSPPSGLFDPVTGISGEVSFDCALIRRQAFMGAKMMTRNLPLYYQDKAISYALRAKGYTLRYLAGFNYARQVPTATSTHEVASQSSEFGFRLYLLMQFGSRLQKCVSKLVLKAYALVSRDKDVRKAHENGTRQAKAWDTSSQKPDCAAKVFGFSDFGRPYERGCFSLDNPDFEEAPDAPLVSIITRSHGERQSHLQNAIMSVDGQTYKNIEHIIVEDRTHFAKATIEEWQPSHFDNTITYIHCDKGGRSNAGNIAMANAKGRYICFLDDDDLLFPDHIASLMAKIMSDQNTQIVYSLAWEAYSAETGQGPEEKRLGMPMAHLQAFSHEILSTENFIPIQSVLFDKALFEECGGFDPSLSAYEDWNLWYRFAQKAVFHCVPKVTSIYRTPFSNSARLQRFKQFRSNYEKVCLANNSAQKA